MIFLFITILTWGILNIGMIGIERGYATWVQARLYATAQFLVLDSYSDNQRQESGEQMTKMAMGPHALETVETTFPRPGVTRIQLSQDIGLPMQSLMIRASSPQASSSIEMTSSATAQLLPARQVGLSHTAPFSLVGALPYVLAKDAWETMTEYEPVDATINSIGEIVYQGKIIGQFAQVLTHIGQAVSASESPHMSQVRVEGYMPIVATIGTRNRVVGFGHVHLDGTPPYLSIRKHVSTTRSQNASTQLTGQLPALSQEELSQVFSLNRTLKGAIVAPTLI
ncbi:hypothetical protein [Nitrospira sp. M1]